MKKITAVFLLSVCLLTGCSGGGSESTSVADNKSNTGDVTDNYGVNNLDSADSYSEGENFSDDTNDNTGSDSTDELDNVSSDEENSNQVDKDMLVYRCTARIDTLEYSDSINKFKSLISSKNGFIENENYSDNGSDYSYYYIEDDDKHSEYTATARIPSNEYDNVVNSFSDLGDVRSQSSNVENMNQEYTDAGVALKIYKAQEKRYISMIDSADPSYALQLQNELTELEIKIAQLKAKINKIETDVAYSYIDITIREVKKYSLHGNTNTFTMRMKDNFGNSWDTFLGVCEWFLTAIIYLWYYIVIVLVIIIVIRKVNKNRKPRLKKHKVQSSYGYYNQPQSFTNATDNLVSNFNEQSNQLQKNEVIDNETSGD